VTRALWLGFFLAATLSAQNKPQTPPPTPATVQEQEPPEEDPDLQPKEYTFNPLEASRNITAGNFYFKKGNYRAASRRYLEASKWDPMSAEALLKLGESYEKLHELTKARETYDKYVTIASDAKDIEAVKKKLAKLPKPRDVK
jgi:tetratricopeptide (TPR) repeat protein